MKTLALIFVAAISLTMTGRTESEKAVPLRYNLNMVHHNPGEPLFDTKYNDPSYLKAQGFNGQVPRIYLPCAITYDSLDPALMPAGSSARQAAEAYARQLDEQIAHAKTAGMPLYPFTDVLVVPKAIQAKFGREMADGKSHGGAAVLGGSKLNADIRQPRTQEILRAQVREIFKRFPDLDGLTIRFGETYLHGFPDYAGGSPVGSAEGHLVLIKLLREEICVKLNKKLFYRTWDFGPFHSPEFYLKVTNAIEPHPNLVFSIKNVAKDFVRLQAFHPCLGIGKHPQIVEVSCNPAGLGGKNTHPYYIGRGVIDGWEECAWLKNRGPARNLRDLLKSPLFLGVWTWARGDGWKGPYLTNELWVDINQGVFSRFAREPWRTEEELFNDTVRQRCRIDGDDLKKMRELSLLSCDAVVRGECSLVAGINNWWCRDEYLTAIDLKNVVRANKTAAVLKEKAEAVRMWRKIEELARQIHLPDPKDQDYLEVSTTYGRIKYEIIEQLWTIQLLAAQGANANAMRPAIAAYDRHWAEWRELKAQHASCPTLYRDDVAVHCGPPFKKVLDSYRRKASLPAEVK